MNVYVLFNKVVGSSFSFHTLSCTKEPTLQDEDDQELIVSSTVKRHCMRIPGTDGNLCIMNINNTKIKIAPSVEEPMLKRGMKPNIRKHDDQVSTYTWFCLDLSCIDSYDTNHSHEQPHAVMVYALRHFFATRRRHRASSITSCSFVFQEGQVKAWTMLPGGK